MLRFKRPVYPIGEAFGGEFMKSHSENPPGEIFPGEPDEECLCGSGQLFKACCMAADGLPHKQFIVKGGKGGLENNRCFLRGYGACSKKISGEHYISKSVLNIFPKFTITGVPWLEKNEKREIGINSLTANILCKKHNENLSVLDDEQIFSSDQRRGESHSKKINVP